MFNLTDYIKNTLRIMSTRLSIRIFLLRRNTQKYLRKQGGVRIQAQVKGNNFFKKETNRNKYFVCTVVEKLKNKL